MSLEETILEKTEKLILEQQVNNLENTLSDTISFFSMALAIGAVFFTILIVLTSWWLNHLFSKKLAKVEVIEQNVSNNLKKINNISKEIDLKYESIKTLHDFVQSEKDKTDGIIENHEFYKINLEYLEEKNKIQEYNLKFYQLIDEVENKIRNITDEELARYYTDEFEGTPEEQFNYDKSYYDEAKNDFKENFNKKYDLMEFIQDKDANYETPSSNILSNLEEANGFLEKLIDIKK